eukprot:XP_001695205.1 predicted protein [Chlamydomonas reinhardtii]
MFMWRVCERARLLMVVLIGLVMTPILIGIALPVFYTAKTARAKETSANVFMCSLYADDRQAEARFYSDLEKSCSIVGQSLWGQMDDDTFSQTPAGNTWLQAVVNIAPVFTAARPPPPPSPASASNASSPQAAGSDAPPDYGSEYEGTFNGTGFDYPPEAPTEPPQAPQAPAPPRPRRPAATPTGSPSSTSSTGNLTMFEKRVAQFPQAVAAWSTINATITSVDVATNAMTISFEMHLDSLVLQTAKNTRIAKRSAKSVANVKFPALLDRTGRIKGKDTLAQTDVVSAAGADGTLSLKTGDRVTSKKMELPLVPTTSLYLYPFDEYTATVTLVSSMTVSNVNCPTALFVKQKNAVVGWVFTAKLVPSVTDNRNVLNFQNPTDPDSAITLTYEIYLKRTTFVQFFAVFVLMGLWLVSACSFCYAMDLLYIRPRNVTNGDATLFTAQLFAVVGTRNIMPGVPAVGVGVDFFGIIWIMIICLLTGGLVYARIVSQYVHKEPTLYDRLAKNDSPTASCHPGCGSSARAAIQAPGGRPWQPWRLHSLLCNDAGTEHSASVYGCWEPKLGVAWDHTEALRAASAVLPEATVRASGRSHCHLTLDALKGGNDGRSLVAAAPTTCIKTCSRAAACLHG